MGNTEKMKPDNENERAENNGLFEGAATFKDYGLSKIQKGIQSIFNQTKNWAKNPSTIVWLL